MHDQITACSCSGVKWQPALHRLAFTICLALLTCFSGCADHPHDEDSATIEAMRIANDYFADEFGARPFNDDTRYSVECMEDGWLWSAWKPVGYEDKQVEVFLGDDGSVDVEVIRVLGIDDVLVPETKGDPLNDLPLGPNGRY